MHTLNRVINITLGTIVLLFLLSPALIWIALILIGTWVSFV